MKPHHLKKEQVAAGKWLSLQKVTWQDDKGRERVYDSCDRTTTKPEMKADCVEIFTFIRSKSSKEQSAILVRQYRPPVDSYMIEFPAGLLDEGESPEEAAVRELKEETGHTGRVLFVSNPTGPNGGISSERAIVVHVEITVDDEEQVRKPMQQHLDDGESIQVMVIPMSELFERLQKYAGEGDLVDAKLWTFAYGWHLSQKQ
ncbi:hypothetical protein PROFUN_09930 [Planoprotostelium fungivorum]|uniref:Nudix hydrolase domain-containing protein n=1 Tax=Planoprotostelium fungivorum TaxID=1890364 RepID=A0A2P6NGA9_9EUKA|nr:hypothetical protein PROFUN_09930 [Planoprotostelium fungivorum]